LLPGDIYSYPIVEVQQDQIEDAPVYIVADWA
jgi:hypothetical protein